jgi:hypothetical protein
MVGGGAWVIMRAQRRKSVSDVGSSPVALTLRITEFHLFLILLSDLFWKNWHRTDHWPPIARYFAKRSLSSSGSYGARLTDGRT